MRTLFFLAIALFLAPRVEAVAQPTVAQPKAEQPKAEQPKLDYEKIAKEFAARNGLDTEHPEAITLGGLYAKQYIHASLGAFYVEWPIAQLPSHAKEFKECCEALVRCQETWLDWVQLKASDQKAVRADLKSVQKWVSGWSVPNLARGKGGTDVLDILPQQPSTVAAYARFNDALQRLTPIGPGRETAEQVQLVFAPTRQDFAEFVYFCGWVLPDLRPSLWIDSVPDWTQCFVQDAQVVGLQYSITGRPPADYTSGSWMNERDPDVMQQQITQLSMNALFINHYKDRVPGAFISGLSMNLVVDTFGVVNTRVDGDTRSKVTQKREVFIPGGASSGGFLAKTSAETRWRENQGADHFLPTLRLAQNEGGDEAKGDKNKAACFSVRNDAGGEKHVVRAPFLGSSAVATKPPPSEFTGDWSEFLRAYKSGFIYWLQTAAAGNEKVSKERFATLLRKLADPNLTTDFEAVFQEVYEGAPLSNPDVDKNCLEGQFLRWLPKSK